MKSELKKQVFELFVLSVLTKGESYGYKIVSDLSMHLPISESTLYPILRRLEAENCLMTRNELFNGRNRKYYKITMQGRSYLNSYLDELEDIKKICQVLLG